MEIRLHGVTAMLMGDWGSEMPLQPNQNKLNPEFSHFVEATK